MNLSFWERNSFFNQIDLTIIGSGIVGLNAAIHYKKLYPKQKVVILERGAIPSGASTRNAGFACFGSISELQADLQLHTEAEMLDLVKLRWEGLQQLRTLLTDNTIGYRPSGNYEVFTDKDSFEKCEQDIAYFNQLLHTITGSKNTYKVADAAISNFGFKNVNHLILNTEEGQIDTGKMMASLLKMATKLDIQIYNGITIDGWNDCDNLIHIFTSNGWKIPSKRLLIATNGFSKKLLPSLDVLPARNQVLITKPIPNLKIKGCFHHENGYNYFRNIGNRILLGGGRHIAKEEEITDSFGQTIKIQNYLTELLHHTILPDQDVEIDYWWSGILGVGNVKVPHVERLSDNIGIAVRLGGMGVAIGSIIGKLGAELFIE